MIVTSKISTALGSNERAREPKRTLSKVPAILLELEVEIFEDGRLGLDAEGHIILYRVEGAEDKVEEGDLCGRDAFRRKGRSCKGSASELTAKCRCSKYRHTTRDKSPSNSLMTAAKDLEVWSSNSQHLFMSARSL